MRPTSSRQRPDDIVTAAPTALHTAVPGEQVAAFDRQVADFQGTIAAVRAHRDGPPIAPAAVNEDTEFLDDPIVTYSVNGLSRRLDTTMSVSG
ncbi:hypothetical protein AB0M12_21405 [Nocardia vinacea]|uniref:hypothetical protein n=1 Tax=Nocardia vinacea TaxID=96468 RepID=UPI003437262D